MMDNLFAIAGNPSITQSLNPASAKRTACPRGESSHVRSNIVSVRRLQRCSCIEPNIWRAGDQRLKREEIIGFDQRLLCNGGETEVDWDGLERPPDVHFWQTSNPQACQE